MELLKQRPTFEMWPIERLHGYAKNPRIHKPADIDKTARFIERFGFKGAIVARSTGEVIDGHLRLKALQKLGWKEVPVVLGDEWTPEEVKAFRLGINRSAEWAEWDEELLRLELSELDAAGFDLEVIDLELDDVQPLESFPELPTGDKSGLETMTFIFSTEQAEQVRAAMQTAKEMGEFTDTGNENSNGNALARVCEIFNGQRDYE